MCVHDAAAGFPPPPNLTRRLQGFFPLGVCLGVDVTCDVVEGEEKVVLVVKLRRKLDLHLRTQWVGGGVKRTPGLAAHASYEPDHLIRSYLIVEVGVLRVMQDCGTGCCGEDRTPWLAVNALNNNSSRKTRVIRSRLAYKDAHKVKIRDISPLTVWRLHHRSCGTQRRQRGYEPGNKRTPVIIGEQQTLENQVHKWRFGGCLLLKLP